MLLLLVDMARAEPPAAPSAPPPASVVTIGDGLVARPAPSEPVRAPQPAPGPKGTSVERGAAPAPEHPEPFVGGTHPEPAGSLPGGWVPVLADCLEERAPARYTVVDRAVPAETIATARDRVAAVRELTPAFVLVTLGGPELGDASTDLGKLRGQLVQLLGELAKGRKSRPQILLLSTLPPTLSQAAPPPHADEDPESAARVQGQIDARAAAWNTTLGDVARTVDGVGHVNLLADWPTDPVARGALTELGWSLSDQGHARVAAAVCDAILAAQKPSKGEREPSRDAPTDAGEDAPDEE